MDEQRKNNSRDTWIFVTAIVLIIFAGLIFSIVRDSTPVAGFAEDLETTSEYSSIFPSWDGREAPDFTVTDIKGEKHSLSDYKGKDVLVVFWATWCPSCNLEIPHLKDLRDSVGKDKLAILAISNEEPETLKKFVAEKNINYTVAALGDSYLPSPFIDVTAIPTTFFIDSEGKIKTTALGLVTLKQSRKILGIESNQ